MKVPIHTDLLPEAGELTNNKDELEALEQENDLLLAKINQQLTDINKEITNIKRMMKGEQ